MLAAALAFLGGCSGTRVLNALVPTSTYRAQLDVPYGADARHKLDVYWPERDAASAPVVIFFYGGSWSRGDRADYRFVGEALASAGIVTVVADYRLSPLVRWRDILRDCASATHWAFDLARKQGSPLYVMGHSAGAYNAAMLALDARWLAAEKMQPSQLAGWIGLAGPYDFLPIHDPDSQVAFDWPDTPRDSQPIAHVSRGAPRALLLAAREDSTVNPIRNTAGLADKLRSAGNAVEVESFDRVNHVTLVGALGTPLRMLAPVRRRVVDFVTKA